MLEAPGYKPTQCRFESYRASFFRGEINTASQEERETRPPILSRVRFADSPAATLAEILDEAGVIVCAIDKDGGFQAKMYYHNDVGDLVKSLMTHIELWVEQNYQDLTI